MSRIRFDEKIEAYLNEQISKLKQLGIKNVSKPDALRFIIEQNKAVQLKVKRKRKSKNGLIFQ